MPSKTCAKSLPKMTPRVPVDENDSVKQNGTDRLFETGMAIPMVFKSWNRASSAHSIRRGEGDCQPDAVGKGGWPRYSSCIRRMVEYKEDAMRNPVIDITLVYCTP
jgi:hypothetical protein